MSRYMNMTTAQRVHIVLAFKKAGAPAVRELLLFCKSVFYRSAPCFCLRLRQSAIMAMNSEFVGLPLMFDTV